LEKLKDQVFLVKKNKVKTWMTIKY